MQNRIQKAVIVIAVITVTLLVSGSPLMAEDRRVGDLITATDLAFIKAPATGIAAGVATDRPAPSAGLITPADYAFAAREYVALSGIRRAQTTPETAGIITAADYRFIAGGEVPDVFTAYNDLSDTIAGDGLGRDLRE